MNHSIPAPAISHPDPPATLNNQEKDADLAAFLSTYSGILDDRKLQLLWLRVSDYYPGKDLEYRIMKAGEFIQEMFECGDIRDVSLPTKKTNASPENSTSTSIKKQVAADNHLNETCPPPDQLTDDAEIEPSFDDFVENHTGHSGDDISYFVALFIDQVPEDDLTAIWNSLPAELTAVERSIEATMAVMNRLDNDQTNNGSSSSDSDATSDEFIMVDPPPPPPEETPYSSGTSSPTDSGAPDAAEQEYVVLNDHRNRDVDSAVQDEDAKLARQLLADEKAMLMELGTLHEQQSLRLAKKLQKEVASISNDSSRKQFRRKHHLHELRGIDLSKNGIRQPLSQEQQEKVDTVRLLLEETIPVSADSIIQSLSKLNYDVDLTVAFLMKNHSDRSYAGRLKGIDKFVAEQKAARAAALQPSQDIIFTPVGKSRKRFGNSASTDNTNDHRSERLKNYLKYCVVQTVRKNNPGIIFNLDEQGEFCFRGFQSANCSKRGRSGKSLIFPVELRYQLGSEIIHASVDLHGLYVESAVLLVDLILDYYRFGEGVGIITSICRDAVSAASQVGKAKKQYGTFILQLIVGKGLHSAGQRPRISPAVQSMLRKDWSMNNFRVDEGRIFVPLSV